MKCGHQNMLSVRLDDSNATIQKFVWLHICRTCRRTEAYVDDFDICADLDDGIVLNPGDRGQKTPGEGE